MVVVIEVVVMGVLLIEVVFSISNCSGSCKRCSILCSGC